MKEEYYTGICKACKSRFRRLKKRGRPIQACDFYMCENKVKEITKKEGDAAAFGRAATLYKEINRKFLKLDTAKQKVLFAVLYEELKRDYATVPVDLRRALTTKAINKESGFVGTDRKAITGFAQRFYAFCVKYRGTTPMELLNKCASDKSGKARRDLEAKIAAQELANVYVNKDGSEDALPYDATAFLEANDVGGVVAFFIGETDVLDFSNVNIPDDDLEFDDEDEFEEISNPAPVVEAEPEPIIFGAFEWG